MTKGKRMRQRGGAIAENAKGIEDGTFPGIAAENIAFGVEDGVGNERVRIGKREVQLNDIQSTETSPERTLSRRF